VLELRKEADAKRALAQRARRLASELTMDDDKARLLAHAAELEEQAQELERRANEVS
jgi:hypothetical protein